MILFFLQSLPSLKHHFANYPLDPEQPFLNQSRPYRNLLSHLKTQSYQSGKYIFREKERARSFFIMREGEVEISVTVRMDEGVKEIIDSELMRMKRT